VVVVVVVVVAAAVAVAAVAPEKSTTLDPAEPGNTPAAQG